MEIRRGYSELYDQSLQLAAQACREQGCTRDDPLDITHAIHVSIILLRHGFPDDVAIAGLLHDSTEKSRASLSEVQSETSATGPMNSPPGSEVGAQGWDRSWALHRREALAVISADALLHARRTAQRVLRGDTLAWKRSNRDSVQMLSYCLQALRVAREGLGHHSLVDELADAVQELLWTVELTKASETKSGTDCYSSDELGRARNLNRAQPHVIGSAALDPTIRLCDRQICGKKSS